MTAKDRPYVLVGNLADLTSPIERGIHSQTINDGDVRVILFAFASGEELSEHTAARSAIIHVLSGRAELTVAGDPIEAGPGTWLRMAARTTHSVRATTPLVMLLYLLPAPE
ncbi:MAG TPA: cupin domain-containing protein [Candidatus Limnocylindrales bacterium]|nr:cupin domain-containing protein [Candidatus Limnocylindrales bacterium]